MNRQRITQLLAFALVIVAVSVWYRTLRQMSAPSPVPIPTETIHATPLAQPNTAPSGSHRLFRPLPPASTGIDYVHQLDLSHRLKSLYFSGFASGGVALGDLDGDGRLDLFIAGGPGDNALYRQVDRLRFEETAHQAGVAAPESWCSGAAIVDINNDGHLDIYVCCYDSPNLLFENRGDGTFRERAAAYGLNLRDASMAPAFADYDRDGDLDLYLLTYRFENPAGWPRTPPIQASGPASAGHKPTLIPGAEKYYEITADNIGFGPVGRADGLLRNNGDGTFTDVTLAAGIAGLGHGLSAVWWDYDHDGWPDLYVGNDFRDPDCLYHNQRDGTFKDIIAAAIPRTTWFSMGSVAADFDNDLRQDLMIADMSNRTHFQQKLNMGNMAVRRDRLDQMYPRQEMANALYHNTGTGRFLEVAHLSGVASTDWTWAVKAGDWDNDGRVDLFFSNGSARPFTNSDIRFDAQTAVGKTTWDLYESAPTAPERDLVYMNHGEGQFHELGDAAGISQPSISMAAAQGDLDGDGDLDFVVARLEEPVQILENLSNRPSVVVRLVGRHSNRYGWGTRAVIHTAHGQQMRWLHPSTGFLGCDESSLHFGLGDLQSVKQLTLEWPSGRLQTFYDLAANHTYTIVEPTDGPLAAMPSQPEPLYQNNKTVIPARHRERPFDDFALQPLLPFRLSQLGPGLAWCDVDRDGDDDFALGGAAGDPTQVWRNDPQGFERVNVPALTDDAACEDMGLLWCDVDSDGDDDLYVVSGGVEHPANAPELADRLYWNQGNWQFVRAGQEQLAPDAQSGGPVAAADFDRDGDLDLFVGGRVQPGQYPTAAPNRLLVNAHGNLSDQVATLAPSLASTGMVTSALWSDFDADGWPDLWLTHEWGPVRVWKNKHGQLQEQTDTMGLATRHGWWQAITGGDIDHDGDIDYALSNMGLNTKYQASDEHPYRIYWGDMDGSGSPQIVEADYEDDLLYPLRGRSCTTQAMPRLATTFPTYRSFAQATLGDIYTDQRLRDAYQLHATCLESGVLRNEGDHFSWHPLPRAAQVSATYGIRFAYINDDPHLDLLLVHNTYSPQPETGRFDHGLGLLLLGHGDGTWQVTEPTESGIVLPLDAKSLTLADANRDGRLDAVVGVNDGPVAVLCRTERRESVSIRLQGPPGNLSATGGRVVVKQSERLVANVEVYAGDGYLSQSSGTLELPASVVKQSQLQVIWPDGSVSIPVSLDNQPSITVRHTNQPSGP